MKSVCIVAVIAAAAGTAMAAPISTGDLARYDVTNNFVAGGTTNAMSAVRGDFSPRAIVANDTYNASAGWGNGTGFAPVVIDGTGAAVPHNGTFDGTTENYAGGLPTQLGDTWGVAEFSGTATNGNEFVQISFFTLGGQTMDAASAGFAQIGMAAGVGFFVSEGQDSLTVDGTGFNFIAAEFGFFGGTGSFLGSADITSNDFSDANGLGAIGILNATNAGIAGNIAEMFIYIEYETIPTPASAALLGLGGLVAIRRRR